MAMRINTNTASINAQRHLNTSRKELDIAMERLSSGQRINSAKDDAAGLAIRDKMTAQIEGLRQAVRNTNDAISLAQTTEGGMEEIASMLQRMRTLSVQAINDTNSSSDRQTLNNEVVELKAEINRIADTTVFNNISLLKDGYSGTFQIGHQAGQTIDLTLNDASATTLGTVYTTDYSTHASTAPSQTVVTSPSTQSTIYSTHSSTPPSSAIAGSVDGTYYSTGQTTTGGYTVGASLNKDMSTSSRTFSSTNSPASSSFSVNASRWSDWGNDIFDGWGNFYIYSPTHNAAVGVTLSTINRPDGEINTQTIDVFGETFTIKHGYPVQGIYKFEITPSDPAFEFQFGGGGNMGSDSRTNNQNLTYSHDSGTLYYNHNYESYDPNEQFYSYFIPANIEDSNSKTYTESLSGDNLYLYSNSVTTGLTVYFSKNNDVKEWIVDHDLNHPTGTIETNTLNFNNLELNTGDRITLNIAGGTQVQGTVGNTGLNALLTSMATSVANQTDLFSGASASGDELTLNGLTDGSAMPAVTVTLEDLADVPAVTGSNSLDFSGLSLNESDRITLAIAGGTQVQGTVGNTGLNALLTSMATSVANQTDLFSGVSASGDELTLNGLTDGSAMAGITVTLESYASTTIADISLLTSDNAASALTTIDQAIHDVSDQRSLLGAFQNRLSHATSNLTNMASNTESARSVIADADYAKEASRLAQQQILQKAQTAMIAQANLVAEAVLKMVK
jgi:flagellin